MTWVTSPGLHLETSTGDIQSFQEIVIFSCILYKKDTPEWELRFWIFKRMLSQAKCLKLRVVVVDDGTSPEFLAELKEFPNLVVVPGYENTQLNDLPNNMSASRRFAAKKSTEIHRDAKYFMYMVPEKADMIDHDKINWIIRQMRNSNALAAVIGRKNFDSLPDFQRRSEIRGNYRLNQILHNDRKFTPLPEHINLEDQYDFFFGVWVFSRSGLEDFYLPYRGNKWSEDSVPLMKAIREVKDRVIKIIVDFKYPPEQMDFEKNANPQGYRGKRILQYWSIISQARHAIL